MTALLAATFLLFQLLCQVFATDGSGCEVPSGYVAYPEYNAAYKIHRNDDVPWAVARDRCVAEGAHLAVITSAEQIKQIVNSTILESELFLYIGIHRSTSSSPWVRVDNGLPVTSIPWSTFTHAADYNCATIWRIDGGVITNADCDFHYAFVCETSLDEGCANPVGHQD